jgi:hypothetical protein
MATLNIGLKVNRAITGATTVNVNAVAYVTYAANNHSLAGVTQNWESNGQQYTGQGLTPLPTGQVCNRVFGPSQAVPASFTTSVPLMTYNGFSWVRTNQTVTWSLLSGVELINTQ